MIVNPSQNNFNIRLKKSPPPPLILPTLNSTQEDENDTNRNDEESKIVNNFCVSTSQQCSHENAPYILPFGQRSQILDTLIKSSSRLLVSSSCERGRRKSQRNVLKRRELSQKVTVPDAEWLSFMRLIIHKPLEDDIKTILDKYKTNFYDRMNVPHTNDAMVRASLCQMVSETLASYSNSTSLSTDTTTINQSTISDVVPMPAKKDIPKRKRKSTIEDITYSSTFPINNQTKFVISCMVPNRCDNETNSKKSSIEQRYKQFHKTYLQFFKHKVNNIEKEYLIREGYLINNQNNDVCLMLYDEIIANMSEADAQSSGISIDRSFLLPEQMLDSIRSSIQQI